MVGRLISIFQILGLGGPRFTWENLQLFTGNGRVQPAGLTTQAINSVRYGYINAEYNCGDVGHGEVDDPRARHVVYARDGAGNSRSRCAFASRIPIVRGRVSLKSALALSAI